MTREHIEDDATFATWCLKFKARLDELKAQLNPSPRKKPATKLETTRLFALALSARALARQAETEEAPHQPDPAA